IQSCLLSFALWYISIKLSARRRLPLTVLSPKSTDIDAQWENGEPPIYFGSRKGHTREAARASVCPFPSPALPPDTSRLRYADLQLINDVVPLFVRLDDLLHRVGHIPEDRHTILLK